MRYKSFNGPNQMSDKELLEALTALTYFAEGDEIDLFASKGVSLMESFDAIPCYVGINEKGKIFLETKKYGPLTLSELDKNLLEDDLYESVFYSLISMLEGSKIPSRLKKIYEGTDCYKGPVKFKATLFPALTHEATKWGEDCVFNVSDYHKGKFGTDGALVVEGVKIYKEGRWGIPILKKKVEESFLKEMGNDLYFEDEGDKTIQEALLEEFCTSDSNTWRVYSPSFMKYDESINIGHDFSVLREKLEAEEGVPNHEILLAANAILSEKMHPQREWLKKKYIPRLRESFQNVLNNLAETCESKLGKDFSERVYPVPRVVLEINLTSGKKMSVLGESKNYKKLKEKRLHYLNEVSNFTDNIKKSILTEAYRVKNDVDIPKVLAETSGNFRSPSHVVEVRKRKFMERVFANLSSNTNENLVREKVGSILESTQNNVEILREEWEAVKDEYNPSIVRKVENKLAKITGGNHRFADGSSKEIPFEESYVGGLTRCHKVSESIKSGFDYVSWIFESVLKDDLETHKNIYEMVLDEEGNVVSSPNDRENVILVHGNFQPWTKSHHNMLEMVKSKLDEVNADRIMLVITEGPSETQRQITEEDRKHPLSFAERRNLLKTLYNEEPFVEVCSQHCHQNSLSEVASFLDENGYNKKIVGVVGEAEITDDFKSDILAEELNSIENEDDLISEDEVRKSVRLNDSSTWLEKYAPDDLTSESRNMYNSIFEKLERIHATLDESNYRKEFKGLFWGTR